MIKGDEAGPKGASGAGPGSLAGRAMTGGDVMGARGGEPLDGRVVEPRNPFADLRARWAIPWVIGVGIVLGVVAMGVGQAFDLDPNDPGVALYAQTFMLYGALASWMLWAFRRHGIRLRGLCERLPKSETERGLLPFGLRLFALLAVAMAFSFGSGMVFLYLVSLISTDLVRLILETGIDLPGEGLASRLGFAVVTVIVAPVFEEGFFRGALVNRWGTKWSLGTAVVMSSIAFGILHANPIGIGMVGVVMALLYIRTRNLLVPILFHAANNLFPTLLLLFMSDEEPFDLATEIQSLRDEIWWGVGLLAISLPLLVWYLRRAWPRGGATIPYSPQ